MLFTVFLNKSELFLVTFGQNRRCFHIGLHLSRLVQLAVSLAHKGLASGHSFHFILIHLLSRCFVHIEFLSDNSISLASIERVALSPLFEVRFFHFFVLSELLIPLSLIYFVLNSKPGHLLLHVLLLIELDLFLAQAELFLLFFEFFSQVLLSLLGLRLFLPFFLVQSEQLELVEGSPFINLILESAYDTNLVHLSLCFLDDPEVLLQSLA